MRCYQFVCFFVFSSNKLTLITFTDFNLGLTCILDQTFLSFLDLRMLGSPLISRTVEGVTMKTDWIRGTVTLVLGILAGKLSN